ncbi:hypothetical protein LTAR_01662 [Leptolinea tardivitalis]|nr:hypothetical protein LTAR_01662 [Leptolinea tardivitalis]
MDFSVKIHMSIVESFVNIRIVLLVGNVYHSVNSRIIAKTNFFKKEYRFPEFSEHVNPTGTFLPNLEVNSRPDYIDQGTLMLPSTAGDSLWG